MSCFSCSEQRVRGELSRKGLVIEQHILILGRSTDIHQDQSFSTEGQFRRIVRMFIIQRRSLYIFTNSLLDNDEVINILAISIICFRSENIQKQQLAPSVYILWGNLRMMLLHQHTRKCHCFRESQMQLRVSIVRQVL